MKKLSLLFVLLVSASLVFGQANGLVISNKASGGAIGTAAATVDVASLFNVNQTTASQTLTVPNLTNATNGKTIHINNVGSASFTLLSKTIEPGTGILLRWTGSAWSISGVGNATGGGGGTADSSVFATQYDISLKVDKSGSKVLTDVNFSAGDKSKLDGIASGATANATNAELRDRATHTGEQAISTVTNLQTVLNSKQDSLSKASSSEINTGTNNAKFTTASGLAGSKYVTTDGAKTYGVATNTGNDYSVTLTPAITSYVTGQSFKVVFTNTNTGAITINFNGLGGKSVVKLNNTALATGDLVTGTIYNLIYDGTNFQIDVGLVGVWYNWVPSFTGFSTPPTVTDARYCLIGKHLSFNLRCVGGVSNSAAKTVNLPVGVSKGAQYLLGIYCVDNNGAGTAGYGMTADGSASLTILKTYAGAVFTASGTCYFLINHIVEIQ